MKRRTFLMLPLLLSACSSLDVAKTVGGAVLGTDDGGLTVDTELQNGDKTINVGETDNSETVIEDNEGTVSIQNTNTDKSFSNSDKVTINEGPDSLTLGLLVLGWLLPSPHEMYREVKSWFLYKFNPVKNVETKES